MGTKKKVEKLFCYCHGIFCGLKNYCRRHKELKINDKPEDSFTIDSCDVEKREMYLKDENNNED